jgi:DNA repair protein RecO (recombination protein O)
VLQLQTEALVLHSFAYRETSRIVRLATREAGVLSVIARGATRPKSRFGSALDLFTSGIAHIAVHPARDLHTLTGFDATRTRAELAGSMARFHAASAVAELCLRFGKEDESGRVHDAATAAFDEIGGATGLAVAMAALAGAWRVVGELGFAPSLEQCASCHAELPPDAEVTFHHRAGGALCAACAPLAQGGRRLPAGARLELLRWMQGGALPEVPHAASIARAHQRLLREFLEEHLGDGRPLRAFVAWEGDRAPATAGTERP